jgi:tetratricopeptide (TPR) repeat protein
MRSITAPILLILASVLVISGCTQQTGSKRILAGDQYMKTGNYPDAAQQYQEAQNKEDSQALSLRLATAKIKAHQYTEALSELERLKHDGPKANYLKAVCYVALNDVAKSKSVLEESLKAKPDDALALSLLGRIHFLQQQYTQSAETYQEALAISSNPKVREILLYNLAVSQMRAGQFTAADLSFKQYLSQHEYVTAQDEKMAGAIAYAAGDRQRALNHWQKLTRKERKAILNAIDTDTQTYQALAVN